MLDLIVIQQSQSQGVALFFGDGSGAFTAGPGFNLSASSVVVGDFNGDGNPDLAIGGSAVTIILGLGNNSFSAPTTFNVPNPSQTTVTLQATDFNGDGKVDLVAACYPNINVLLSNGDGTFGAPLTTLNDGGSGTSLAVGDFNNDGKPDVISDSVFFAGAGDGTFAAPFNVGTALGALVVADFNSDGNLDLLSTGPPDNPANTQILLGNGNGTFTPSTAYPDLYNVVGDVNGDGKLDIVGSDGVAPGNGDGTFQPPVPLFSSFAQRLFAAADINNNGQLDFVDAESGSTSAVLIYLGTESPSVALTATPNPVASNAPFTLTATITPLTATGSVTFIDGATTLGTSPVSAGIATLAVSIPAAGRHLLNAQYSGDPLTSPANSGPITVTVNGSPSTTTLAVSSATPTYGQPITLTATVSPAPASGSVTFYADGSILLGAPQVQSGVATLITSDLSTGKHVIVAQFNGSGNTSFSISSSVTVTVTAKLGGAYPSSTPISNSDIEDVFSADVNNDGLTDILATNYGENFFSVFLSTGNGTFAPPINYALSYPDDQASRITPVDLNNDGVLDLAVDSSYGLEFYFGNGDGTFRLAGLLDVYDTHFFADFNHDGRVDLIESAYSANPPQFNLFLGNGDGTFQPPVSTSIPSESNLLAVADFNHDGNPDLALAVGSTLAIYLGHGDSTFAAPVTVPLFGPADSVAVGDVNNDGKPDLVVSEFSLFAVLLGNGDGTFTTGNSFTSIGDTNYLYLADLTGDGNLDVFVIPLRGFNTFLYPGDGHGGFGLGSPASPMEDGLIAFGNFSGTGRVDIASGQDLYPGLQPSSLTLTATPNPAALGQPITLTATLFPANSGTVTFYDGGVVVGTAPLVSGTATLQLSSLTANQHAFTTSYPGDAITVPTVSPVLYETVTGVPASLTLSTTTTTFTFGQPAVLTATVSPASATGPVTFLSGSQLLGSAPVLNGTATLTTSLLPVGPQTLRAIYQGDTTNAAAPSTNSIAVQVKTLPASAYRFLPVTLFPGTTPVAAADFNGDGITDLIVTGTNDFTAPNPSVYILLGNGDGTFRNGWSLNSGYVDLPLVAVADFNSDGKPDFAFVDAGAFPGFGGPITIYLNQGDGTFVAGTPLSQTAIALAAGDFNGDGIPDLVTVDQYMNVVVWRGSGNGTFSSIPQSLAAGTNNYGLSILVSDFNADGKSDIEIHQLNYDTTSVFLGNGNGTFQPATEFPSNAFTLAIADLNHDGFPDLVAITANLLRVSLGLGNGAFAVPVTYNSGVDNSAHLAVSDFNGDGKLDIVVQGYSAFSCLYGNGDGTFQTPIVFQQALTSVVVADYNGDGRADFPGLLGTGADSLTLTTSTSTAPLGQPITLTATISPSTTTGVIIFFSGATVLGTAPITNGVATLTITPPSSGLQSITAVYQGDANHEFMASAAAPVTVTTAPGGDLTPAATIPTGIDPQALATADFNHDGHPDLAVVNTTDNTVSVFWGDSAGAFPTSSTFPTGTTPIALVAADFNGDGVSDLVIANSGSNNLTVLLSSGGSLISAASVPLTLAPRALAAGDLNRDGKTDLAVSGDGSPGSGALLLGNGDGTFTPHTSPTLYGPMFIVDLNGDNVPDLVTRGLVYLGDGQGNFPSSKSIPSSYTFAIADFNHDGKLDIASITTNYPSSGIAVSFGNGDATFQTPIDYPVARNPNAMVAGDFNGDGIPDLALANGDGTVGLMFGNPDGSLQPEITFPAGNYPNAIAIGDFNSDGRLDVITSNFRDNTLSLFFGAATSCSVTISPAAFQLPQTGGPATVNVTSAPTCQWSANYVAADNRNATPFVANGIGNGSFTVMVPANNTGAPATNAIDVNNQKATVSVAQTNQQFADVPVTAYYFDAVNLLKQQNITAGCSATDFCPTDTVTRAEMAIFIVRGILHTDQFSYTTAPYFTDVPPTAFGFAWIQKLRDLNITAGCGPSLFCPNDPVTRAQAAIFLIRARYGVTTPFPYSTTPIFTDVPTTEFAFQWIQRLKQDNITYGCSATTFCPDSNIIRGDMAIFIERALFNDLLPPASPVINFGYYLSQRGPLLVIEVEASNTHFNQATSQVLVPGLIITTVSVQSTAEITITGTRDTSIPPGPASVTVVTGDEVVVGPNLLQLP